MPVEQLRHIGITGGQPTPGIQRIIDTAKFEPHRLNDDPCRGDQLIATLGLITHEVQNLQAETVPRFFIVTQESVDGVVESIRNLMREGKVTPDVTRHISLIQSGGEFRQQTDYETGMEIARIPEGMSPYPNHLPPSVRSFIPQAA